MNGKFKRKNLLSNKNIVQMRGQNAFREQDQKWFVNCSPLNPFFETWPIHPISDTYDGSIKLPRLFLGKLCKMFLLDLGMKITLLHMILVLDIMCQAIWKLNEIGVSARPLLGMMIKFPQAMWYMGSQGIRSYAGFVHLRQNKIPGHFQDMFVNFPGHVLSQRM